ncbi:MAG: sialidase family protein [Planctomycetia bacterium]|nr:sialidase family protein [Planctomycetia bacterium]
MKKTCMKKFGLWTFVGCVILCGQTLLAQDNPALDVPQVLAPLPEKYADEFRKFQGIPSLAVTSNEDIWVTWYTGGVTEDKDNYVVLIRSRDGGKTWSKPLFAIDQPGEPRQYDPSMWYAPDGKLYLYWSQRPGHAWEADLWMMCTANPHDEKPVWSKPRFITQGVMMNKPIADSLGRWILPVSVWNLPWAGYAPSENGRPTVARSPDRSPNGPCGAWFVVSTDEGKNWTKLGRGYTPPERALFDEHSIVELNDGRFWIMNRTNRGIGDFYSSDGGKTWTDFQESKIKHTSSRFFLRRLQSENLILVKNGPIDQDVGRSRMMAFLSKDEGKTWEGGLMLDTRNHVSYPDGDQTPDGTIYIVYDFERQGAKEILCARITEADILAGKLVSPKSQLRILANKATGKMIVENLQMAPHTDGKPFQSSDPRAIFKAVRNGDRVELFETGRKLFGDRGYLLREAPDYLKGRHFLFSQTMGNCEAECTQSGMAYVLTPLPSRNGESQSQELLKQGFEKAAKPEFLLFEGGSANVVTLYQKKVEKGEKIALKKWGVLVF